MCGEGKGYWDHLRESFYEDLTGKNPSSFLGYTIRAVQQTDVLWRQLGGGVVDLVGGATTTVASGALMVKSSGLTAIALYPIFVESIALTGYGIAEISSGLMGQKMPNSIELLKDIIDIVLPKRTKNRDNNNLF